MEKRNPNFLRFGRSDLQMRLSRSNGPNFLRFGEYLRSQIETEYHAYAAKLETEYHRPP